MGVRLNLNANLNSYGLKSLDFKATETSQADGINRREFIMTSLAIGFAFASSPIMAQAISTDDNGLIAGEVSVPVADGSMPAYRAMPNKGKIYQWF